MSTTNLNVSTADRAIPLSILNVSPTIRVISLSELDVSATEIHIPQPARPFQLPFG
jgi:hypothetical protein